MKDFWTQIEEARARCNVLEHSFYQRWSRGELSREELATYAGQYRHAVVALADASASAARAADPALRRRLEAHAAEEASHIALWDGFGEAVDGDPAAEPTPETEACARAWAGESERTTAQGLVALYAIESGQPAISETKLAGLRDHYGIDDPAATAYFELHTTLDHEHAASERAILEPILEEADADALLAEAEAALRGNWALLDGVERLNKGA